MFGNKNEEWLRQFLELPNVIPSHDPFGRVFWVSRCAVISGLFYGMGKSGKPDHALKLEKTANGGIQAKRLQAAWDMDYLLKVILV